MEDVLVAQGTEQAAIPTVPATGWKRPFLVGMICFVIYLMNCRAIIVGDAVPATLLPLTLIRVEGVSLDRFRAHFEHEGGIPYFATVRRGHLVSVYPIGSGFVASVFIWPQILILDRLSPGWDAEATPTVGICIWMGKIAAAIIAALLAAALVKLADAVGLQDVGTTVAFSAALGSNLWVVGSQTLWQHASAALGLTLAIVALVPTERSRSRLFLAGLATAAMVCCRTNMLLFALTIGLWVLFAEGRRSGWFGIMPLLLGITLLGYNFWMFGSLVGGAIHLESSVEHVGRHGVLGAWSGTILDGASGTLFSPSRGLFVFTPWIPLAIGALPFSAARLRRLPLVCWLFLTLIPFFVLNSCYAVWWGGHSFGPRYWTDVIPLFSIMLGLAITWSRQQARPVYWLLLLAIATSIAIQVVGAFCYPSGWNRTPVDVDTFHERLWDWRDNELSRSLKNGPRPLFSIDG